MLWHVYSCYKYFELNGDVTTVDAKWIGFFESKTSVEAARECKIQKGLENPLNNWYFYSAVPEGWEMLINIKYKQLELIYEMESL